MSFTVYILKSEKEDRYYIGSTESIEDRLKIHNGSHAKWTKRFQPWNVVYTETYLTRGEAVKREREIKRVKGVEKFLKQMG